MTSWIRSQYHRDKQKRKVLRGNLDTRFNDLLDTKAFIGRETKEGEIEDYDGRIWEGIRMANNGSKKVVSM